MKQIVQLRFTIFILQLNGLYKHIGMPYLTLNSTFNSFSSTWNSTLPDLFPAIDDPKLQQVGSISRPRCGDSRWLARLP